MIFNHQQHNKQINKINVRMHTSSQCALRSAPTFDLKYTTVWRQYWGGGYMEHPPGQIVTDPTPGDSRLF